MSAGRRRENESAGKSSVRVRVDRRSRRKQKVEECRCGELEEGKV